MITCACIYLVIELILLFDDPDAVKEAIGEGGDENEEEDQSAEEENPRHRSSGRSPEDGPAAQRQKDQLDGQSDEKSFAFRRAAQLLRPERHNLHPGQQDHGDGRGDGQSGQQAGRYGPQVALASKDPSEIALTLKLAHGAGRPGGIVCSVAAAVSSAESRHVIHRSGRHRRVARYGRCVVSPSVILRRVKPFNSVSGACNRNNKRPRHNQKQFRLQKLLFIHQVGPDVFFIYTTSHAADPSRDGRRSALRALILNLISIAFE